MHRVGVTSDREDIKKQASCPVPTRSLRKGKGLPVHP